MCSKGRVAVSDSRNEASSWLRSCHYLCPREISTDLQAEQISAHAGWSNIWRVELSSWRPALFVHEKAFVPEDFSLVYGSTLTVLNDVPILRPYNRKRRHSPSHLADFKDQSLVRVGYSRII